MTLLQLLFSFEGRIGRSTWWLASIVMGFVCGLLMVVVAAIAGHWAGLLALLPMYWSCFSLNAKRLHDRGKSGWWQGIGLVGFIFVGLGSAVASQGSAFGIVAIPLMLASFVVSLWSLWILIEMAFLAGTPGANDFGTRDPLDFGRSDSDSEPSYTPRPMSDLARTTAATSAPSADGAARPKQVQAPDRRRGFGTRTDGGRDRRSPPQSFGRRAPA
jgi:uncharacterized membrane protein YhaH (DUF805 family)